MKFKLGDKVKNIINGNIGKIVEIDVTDEVDNLHGFFCKSYYVDYGVFRVWNTIVELEKVPEILDEEEKEYLTNVIKPFKNRVKTISKIASVVYPKCELIVIEVIAVDKSSKKRFCLNSILLPVFKKNTMYKGMEISKKYTLKELNL